MKFANGELALLNRQTLALRPNVRIKFKTIKQYIPPLVLFVCLLLQLTVRLQSLKSSYLVEELRQHALNKDAELRQVQFEYAALTSPNNLLKLAGEKLSMTKLAPQNMRKIQG